MTLTGAGGAGKTRLAVQIAAEMAADSPTGSGTSTWRRSPIPRWCRSRWPARWACPTSPADRRWTCCCGSFATASMLMVLDNCEHLLDASAELIAELLAACPALTLLATSREPIGVAGEVSWRVPSLSLADEADRVVRRPRPPGPSPTSRVTDDNAEAVTEICRRLDGMPLAIELAAARVRALSPAEILDSLHDRFRLLTGGARTAVRRQQTLRASVDWSHALLTEPEQVLFRRLAVFFGGFDLDAAQAVAAMARWSAIRYSTSSACWSTSRSWSPTTPAAGTRYRLLETVRQYARRNSASPAKADDVRARHRDHYTAMAALLDAPAGARPRAAIEQAETEIDNLRAAFAWSRENSDTELALALASSLQPLWLARGRIQEGLNWLECRACRRTARRADRIGGAGAGIRGRAVLLSFRGMTRRTRRRRANPGGGAGTG